MVTLSLYAGYYDSGYIEWSQPNGITFIARLVWDEFCAMFETTDGYQIKMGDDYYYYYAILDINGDFTASNNRVSIDSPLKESCKLKRSQKCQADIDAKKEASNEEARQLITEMIGSVSTVSLNSDKPIAKSTSGMSSNPIHMGIVLVEFSDVERYGYDPDDFNKMMFSSNHEWYSTTEGNSIHPEGDRIYGSFREYWTEQTNGSITFTETSGIIYPPGSSDPWHELSYTKLYYDNQSSAITTIANELDLDSSPYDEYDKIVIIYAKDTFYEGGLTPHARYLNDRYYILGEQHRRLNSGWKFTHIGGHCHEFGHCLGLPHLADGDYENAREDWYYALMEVGDMCGPLQNGECPSGINPLYKIANSWMSSEGIHYIYSDTENITISYNYTNPQYYVVNRSVTYSGSFFILENRLREYFDYYTPNNPSYQGETGDPNGNEGGLLIWRIEPSWIHLVPADNEKSDNYQNLDLENRSYSQDPFPKYQHQNFNGNTIPDSKNRNGYDLHYAVQNIRWNDTNKKVTVDIYTNAWAGTISSNTTWDKDVYVYDDITIDQGITLTIMPGTGVFIAQTAKITVEGHISASGTSAYPIKFQSNGSHNPLDIRNSSQFNYCQFKGTGFIYLRNQPSTFSHCVFTGGPTIKTESNGTFNMDNCIVENGFCGMGITTGTAGISYLTNCTIRNNTSWGIKTSYDGRVVLNKTEVYDNGDGIVVGYHGILDLTPGRNAIINNNYNEININDQLTAIYPNNAYWYGDIYDNENPSPGYYIDNFYQTTQGEYIYDHYVNVKAELVWWGTTNTTYISQRFSAPGYIDFSPIATSSQTAEFNIGAPETGLPLAKRVSSVPIVSLSPLNLDNSAPKVASSVLSAGIAKTVAPDKDDDEKEAKLSLKESIQAIKNQIRSEPYSESNPGRFLKLYSLLREDPEDNTGEYRSVFDIVSQYRARSEEIHDQSLIKNEKNSKRKELYELEKLTGEVCMIIEVDDLIWKYKKYDEALALIQRLYPKVTTYDCRRELKMCEIAIYKFTEDWKKGLEAVQELKEEVKNTDLKDYTPPDYTDLENEFRMKLGLEPILAKEAPYFRKDKEEVLAMIPGEFALKHNYPNPFNPMTTIPFDLPEASRVQIHIYDLTGREVAVVASGQYSAGSHTVTFNGSGLPSGIYLIRAQMLAEDSQKEMHCFTGKMMLMK